MIHGGDDDGGAAAAPVLLLFADIGWRVLLVGCCRFAGWWLLFPAVSNVLLLDIRLHFGILVFHYVSFHFIIIIIFTEFLLFIPGLPPSSSFSLICGALSKVLYE